MSGRRRAAIFGFGIVVVFAAGLARSAQAQETEKPEALIKQGISLRRKGDDRRAYGYLKRAYDLAKTPRSAAQLGLVEQALGQFADAQIHLSEALATKDAWVQENRVQLDESQNFVRSKLAKVAITGAPGDATIAVGSDPPFALPRDGVVWLAPGANTVVVAAPGRKPVTKTVTAGPGESTSVAVELPADAPPTPPAAAASAGIDAAPGGPTPAPVEVIQVPAPAETGQSSTGRTLRITGIGVAAAGVALAVTGFVLRGIASSKLDAIQSDAAAPRLYNESNDNWQTFEHAGVALLVTGGAAAVAGALLYVLNLPSGGEGHDAKVSLVVLPRETGASLQLGARF
jgi:hypothetical protein